MFAALHAPGNLALLTECARHFSPFIEDIPPDTVVFDLRGLSLLIGTPAQIASAIERRVGVPANLALASNPDAAIHAARGLRGVTILPPGEEAAALARLPLYLLGGSPDFARSVDLWGIRTFGEFAALPPLGVIARLGEEGAHLQALACGRGHRQLNPLTDPLIFRAEEELETPVRLLEPLMFLFSRMLGELCERLRFHGRSTNELRLCLKLERSANHTATLRLPVPMLDSKVLLKLLELELNQHPPKAAVEKIHMELIPVEPRTTQHGLFLPSSPEPEKLEITLARIRALVGAGNIGAPEVLNTHRPDSFRMGHLRSRTGGQVFAPRLALRRFRPPHPAQVWCAEGKPVKVISPQTEGRVIACAGPWRLSGDWWRDDAWERKSWDVEIQNTGAFRLSEEAQGRWFLEGNYD